MKNMNITWARLLKNITAFIQHETVVFGELTKEIKKGPKPNYIFIYQFSNMINSLVLSLFHQTNKKVPSKNDSLIYSEVICKQTSYINSIANRK